MTLKLILSGLCLPLLAALFVCGCQQSARVDDADSQIKQGEINGYYELRRDGTLYILGSLASVDALQAGKLMPKSIRSYTSQGESLVFEANGMGLELRLRAEYDRRHPSMR